MIRHKENFWLIYRLLEMVGRAEEFNHLSIKRKNKVHKNKDLAEGNEMSSQT